MVPLSPEDLLDARGLLADVIAPSPVQGSRWLSERAGTTVLLKCENLQRAGSFKIRGAYVRIARLSPAERARGVVAASAGNHAQGVALAASLLDTRATVFMPDGAPLVKERATRGYGADVRFHGRTVDEALVAAHEYAETTGAVLIHPFDHADVVAGQASVGLEILEQVPDVGTIVVGTGGGGLLAGVAAAVAATRPDVTLIGVQAEGAAAYPASLRAGHPVALPSMTTMADGIAVGRPGAVPFALVQQHVDRVETVSEDALSRALVLLLERAKMVVEPAGAAAVAGVLESTEALTGPVVAILSGGNIDPLLLLRVVRHGLAADGRYLAVRVLIPDAPGALATLLGELASADANVLDVVHERTSASLDVDQVAVALQLETRGVDHCTRLIQHLRQLAYRVVLPRE